LCISHENGYKFLKIKSMNKYAVSKAGFMRNSARIRRLATNLKIKFRNFDIRLLAQKLLNFIWVMRRNAGVLEGFGSGRNGYFDF
jgi:hypothetical protein